MYIADIEMVDMELGLVHTKHKFRAIGAFPSTETILHDATHHTRFTFDPNGMEYPLSLLVGIPFTDHCELFIQRPGVDGMCSY